MKANLLAVHPVLMAKDVKDSVEFYRTLGFVRTFQDAPEQPRYAGVRRDTIEIHIQWAAPNQWAYPTDRPAYRFLVADVDLLYEELRAGGSVNMKASQGSPWSAPADTPWGTREFHLRDPGENSLQFYQALQISA